jgi:hypothetical protein
MALRSPTARCALAPLACSHLFSTRPESRQIERRAEQVRRTQSIAICAGQAAVALAVEGEAQLAHLRSLRGGQRDVDEADRLPRGCPPVGPEMPVVATPRSVAKRVAHAFRHRACGRLGDGAVLGEHSLGHAEQRGLRVVSSNATTPPLKYADEPGVAVRISPIMPPVHDSATASVMPRSIRSLPVTDSSVLLALGVDEHAEPFAQQRERPLELRLRLTSRSRRARRAARDCPGTGCGSRARRLRGRHLAQHLVEVRLADAEGAQQRSALPRVDLAPRRDPREHLLVHNLVELARDAGHAEEERPTS